MPAGPNSDILLLSFSTSTAVEITWQFIKTEKIPFAIRLQYIFFPKPTLIFPAFKTFIGFVGTRGSTDDSRKGNVRKSKPHWSTVPHRSLDFFYCLISQWPLSDAGVCLCLQVFCVCAKAERQREAEQQKDWRCILNHTFFLQSVWL